MAHRWRVLLTVLALGATACSSSTGVSEDAVGPSPQTGKVADSATARTVLIQEVDMPAGWRGVAHTEDPLERARSRDLSICIGRGDPEETRSVIVYGPDLTMGQTQLSTIATVVNTFEDAQADLKAVLGPRFGDCVLKAFREDLTRQAPTARIENGAVAPLEVQSFGDGSAGVRLTIDLVYPDRTDNLFADLIYISKDRTTVSSTFFSFGDPFPGDLQRALVSRMGNRIATA